MATPLQQIADELEPALRREFQRMVGRILEQVPESILVEALEAGDRWFVMEAFRKAAQTAHFADTQALSAVFTELLVRSAQLTATSVGYSLTLNNPRVASWITRNVGSLVTRIGAQTMQSIRQTVLGGFVDGVVPRVQAQTIRQVIGLTGRDNDVDTTRAKEDLGWRTRVPYEEGIKTIQEYAKGLFSNEPC